jgi:hypothetical protein
MSKLILFLSAVGLAVMLLCGLFFPSSPVMWLASTGAGYMWLRLGLVLMLAVLIVTNPPRNIYFRTAVSLVTAGIMYWVVTATYNNHMLWMDSLSLMSASLAAFIVALERGWEERVEKLQTVLQPESSLKA